MNEVLQNLLDAVARWGSALLLALMIIPVTQLWRVWRNRSAFSQYTPGRGLIVNCWWLVALASGVWVLEVRLAPLTNSLASLQAVRSEKFPDVSFRRASDDSLLHLREFAGKVVLLNLWASYCPPCIKEIPDLARLQATYSTHGLLVVALSDEPREVVRDFVQRVPVALLIGYTSSFAGLQIKNFRPFTLIIDRCGVLRKHYFGASSYESLEKLVQTYLAEKVHCNIINNDAEKVITSSPAVHTPAGLARLDRRRKPRFVDQETRSLSDRKG